MPCTMVVMRYITMGWSEVKFDVSYKINNTGGTDSCIGMNCISIPLPVMYTATLGTE